MNNYDLIKSKELENKLKPIINFCEVIYFDDALMNIGLKQGISFKEFKNFFQIYQEKS